MLRFVRYDPFDDRFTCCVDIVRWIKTWSRYDREAQVLAQKFARCSKCGRKWSMWSSASSPSTIIGEQ